MSQIKIQKCTDEILEALDYYRGIVLDAIEQEYGGSQGWLSVRSRVLKAFGERGLEHRIRSIMFNPKNFE